MSTFCLILCVILIGLNLSLSIPVTTRDNLIYNKLHNPVITHSSQVPFNIIGGKKAYISQHPYQVAIVVNGTFQGSGIIIDHNWVATLASILLRIEPDDVSVLAGNTNYLKGKNLKAKKIVLHEKFDFFKLSNDIALINVNYVKFNKNIKAVAIGPKRVKDGTSVTISGWGDTTKEGKSSPQLTSTTLNIVNIDKCKTSYGGYSSSNSMICAQKKNVGPCWNDFGDVIIAKKKAYGLFSFAKGCDVNSYPGVYTDLVSLHPWIKSVINNKSNSDVNEHGFEAVSDIGYEQEEGGEKVTQPENLSDLFELVAKSLLISQKVSSNLEQTDKSYFDNIDRDELISLKEFLQDASEINEDEDDYDMKELYDFEEEINKEEEEEAALEAEDNDSDEEERESDNEKADEQEMDTMEEGGTRIVINKRETKIRAQHNYDNIEIDEDGEDSDDKFDEVIEELDDDDTQNEIQSNVASKETPKEMNGENGEEEFDLVGRTLDSDKKMKSDDRIPLLKEENDKSQLDNVNKVITTSNDDVQKIDGTEEEQKEPQHIDVYFPTDEDEYYHHDYNPEFYTL